MSQEPLTYHVDALRTLMIQGGASTYGLRVDFAVLAAILTVFVAIDPAGSTPPWPRR